MSSLKHRGCSQVHHNGMETTKTDKNNNQAYREEVDVIKADYYTDDDLFIREVGLYKLSTGEVLANPEISRVIRKAAPHY